VLLLGRAVDGTEKNSPCWITRAASLDGASPPDGQPMMPLLGDNDVMHLPVGSVSLGYQPNLSVIVPNQSISRGNAMIGLASPLVKGGASVPKSIGLPASNTLRLPLGSIAV
jgi:hypothetical protein